MSGVICQVSCFKFLASFFPNKGVGLVGGGSVINRAYPIVCIINGVCPKGWECWLLETGIAMEECGIGRTHRF